MDCRDVEIESLSEDSTETDVKAPRRRGGNVERSDSERDPTEERIGNEISHQLWGTVQLFRLGLPNAVVCGDSAKLRNDFSVTCFSAGYFSEQRMPTPNGCGALTLRREI